MSKVSVQPRFAQSASDGVLDVLVIGGGIVGAGIARDAALRRLRTGLIEQQDFAAGTSSRSSRLLHGGIRYLSQGRIGLVREANREKTVVHQIAPHLSQPLAFIFPTRKKSVWSRWKLGIGVKIYDLLCGRRNLGKSTILNRSRTLQLLPMLETTALTGAVRYYDGLTNDARLVLDTLHSATNAGALVSNYIRFIDAERIEDQWRCRLENALTNKQFNVTAKSLVNATGPWSNRTPHSRTNLRLTKGVHLVIDASHLPIPDAVVIAEGDRILFAIPWGERVILGTTDTDYNGPLETPQCEGKDIDYVLDAVNDAFPEAALKQADVISTWAGIRPLVADSQGNPSDISRRHEITMSHPGWWDVTGGKLTTYRLMAEETLDDIVSYLDLTHESCSTAESPLISPQELNGASQILPPAIDRKLVEHYCRNEWAVHLDDVMDRRTSWRFYHTEHLRIVQDVANWMAEALEWSQEKKSEELDRYKLLAESSSDLAGPHFPIDVEHALKSGSELQPTTRR